MWDIKDNKNINLNYHKKNLDIAAGGRSYDLESTTNADVVLGSVKSKANYSDQIPPFTITLTGNNESGASMWMAVLGVELLNEGAGLSIDDIVNETQMTFVARSIIPWQPKRGEMDNFNGLADEAVAKFSKTAAFRSMELANTIPTSTT